MRIKRLVISLGLMGLCLMLQGCAVLLVGAVAAGATGGAVSYFGNELQTLQEVGIDKAWKAVQVATSELQFRREIDRSRKDGIKAVLVCRNADNQQIVIQLSRQTDRLTEIRIRVGVFDTTSNRQAAQLIYDKMRVKM
jgi:hypothetical protein